MMNTEKKSCEDIQKLLKALLSYTPELKYEEPLKAADHEIKDALAKAFGEPGFRKYLENGINVAKDNAAMNPGNLYQSMFARGRIEAFIEIYAVARQAFSLTLEAEKRKKNVYEKEQEQIYSPGGREGIESQPAENPGEDPGKGGEGTGK